MAKIITVRALFPQFVNQFDSANTRLSQTSVAIKHGIGIIIF